MPKTTTVEEEIENQRRILKEKQKRNSLLLNAIQKKNILEVKRLLEEGVSPNATCRKTLRSACHIAAYMNWDALRSLLTAGADRYRKDKCGLTPLHCAAIAGGSRRIAMLLDFPEDLQFKTAVSITLKTIEEIKKFRPFISNENNQLINEVIALNENEITPEEYCYDDLIDDEKHDCADMEKKYSSNDCCQPLRTALHVASASNKSTCVCVLLAAGADPNVVDKNQDTAMDLADRFSYYIDYKITYKCKENKKSFIEIIKSLVEFGGTVHATRFHSALRTAVMRGCPEVLPTLLKAGAPVLIKGKYPLIDLCMHNNMSESYTILVEYANRVHGTTFPLKLINKKTDQQSDMQTNKQTDDRTDRQIDTPTDGRTDKQTEMQADDHTGKQTDQQPDMQVDDQTEKQIDTPTDGRTDKQTEMQADDHTGKQTYQQPDMQVDDQTEKQIDTPTDGQTDKQTEMQADDHTDKQTYQPPDMQVDDETEKQIDTPTDGRTDKQIEMQADDHTGKQTYQQPDMQVDDETEEQTDTQTDAQANNQISTQADDQLDNQADQQTNMQTDDQTAKQTDVQTVKKTHNHTAECVEEICAKRLKK